MMRIGVAIPSYLGATFIGRTLRSLTEQTHEDWYCVVVNDGEEDGTANVIAELGDHRVRYVCDGKRRGQFPNFNRAVIEVLKSDPDVVRMLCSDDVLYPHDLADMVRVLSANPSVGLVATHYDGIDESDRLLFRADLSGRDDLVMKGRDYLLQGLAVGNTIGGPSSVAVRREAFETAGLFDPRVNHSGEADLWHRIAASWDIAWVGRRAGLQYRLHRASVTGRGRTSVARFTDPIQMVRRVASTEAPFGPRWWMYQYTIGRLHGITIQLTAAMARRGDWVGVRAGLLAAVREGAILYLPFWLPRLPWIFGRALLGRSPSRRLLLRRVHERLQPPVRPVPREADGGSRTPASQPQSADSLHVAGPDRDHPLGVSNG